MDQIDIKHDYGGKILKRVAEKVVSMYIPPLTTITDISSADAINVAAAEQIADITFLEPSARILYELNCEERKLHELSLNIHNRSADTAAPWSYAAPKTNGDRLLKLMCR
jgi:hypothetical protein